jgi:hypothetical protein
MPTKSKTSTLITVLLTSGLLMACQEKKQLNEMHDSTVQMNATTQKMAANMEKTVAIMEKTMTALDKSNEQMEKLKVTTDRAAGSSEKVVPLIAESYDLARQGGAHTIRKDLFDSMLKVDMPVDRKLVAAGEYMVAFEFQLWSGLGQDIEGKNSKAKDKLSKDAVTEFFNNLATVSRWSGPSNPFARPQYTPFGKLNWTINAGPEENEMAVFNVMAAALHKTNRKQEGYAEFNQVDPISMFSLIQNALVASLQIRSGEKKIEDFPIYVDELLRSEPLAIRLLQARYNMLGLVLLGRVTSISDSLLEGMKFLYLDKKWTLDLDRMNISQVRFYRMHLTEAQKTRDLLKKIGAEIPVHSKLKAIYSNMTVKNSTAGAAADRALADDKMFFVNSLKQYLNP